MPISTSIVIQKQETLMLSDEDSDYKMFISEDTVNSGNLKVTIYDGSDETTFFAEEGAVPSLKDFLGHTWPEPKKLPYPQSAINAALKNFISKEEHVRQLHINSSADKDTPLVGQIGKFSGGFVGLQLSETFTSPTVDAGTIMLSVDQMVELHAHLDKLIEAARSMIKEGG